MTELNTQENPFHPNPTAPAPAPSLLYGFVKESNWSRALAIITVNSRHAQCLLVVLLTNDYFDFVFKAFYALLEYQLVVREKQFVLAKLWKKDETGFCMQE